MSGTKDIAHSPLGPSSAHRWMECPGSVELNKIYKDPGSVHAAEGVATHDLAEVVLREDRGVKEFIGQYFNGFKVDEDMASHVLKYVEVVNSYKSSNCELFVEVKVKLNHLIPDCFGTADAVILDYENSELIVIDLKYGRGVKVNAKENYQLRLYLLGALEEFGIMFEPKRFRSVIFQPRLNWHDEEVLTPNELESFAVKVRKAYEAVLLPNPSYNPGESQCRWCRAKAVCPAMRDITFQTVAEEFDGNTVAHLKELGTLQPSDLEKLYPQMDLIIGWCKSVKDKVYSNAVNGYPLDRYKLVAGKKGHRNWISQPDVEKVIRKLKITKKDAYETKLKSPAQMQKVAGRSWEKFEDLIQQSEGKPILVDRSDDRPEISTSVEFEDLNSGEN